MSRVALVLVSHAAATAQGTAEIAGQMAPDVVVLAAGGADGRIGTSVDLVLARIEEAASDAAGPGGGVVVVTDLGSAVMSAESALEILEATDPALAGRVRIPQAPFVEGAVSAAVEAQQGGDLEAVTGAAVAAGRVFAARPGDDAAAPRVGGDGPSAPSGADVPASADGPRPEKVAERVVLPDGLGLHARPAALLARAVAALGVPVRLDGANAASVLELMGLGAGGGAELVVEAEGPGAEHAVAEVVRMLREGLEG